MNKFLFAFDQRVVDTSFSSFSYDGYNSDTTTRRNAFTTATESWNDFGQSKGSNTGNVYNEDNYSQFAGHETSRPVSNVNAGRGNVNSGQSNNNNNDYYNPIANTNANQGRETNNQPREISPNSFGFISDSLGGSSSSGNGRNVNSVTQRPVNQQQTTTTQDYNNRRKSSSTTNYDTNRSTQSSINYDSDNNRNRRTTSTTSNYDYNVYQRTTASSYRPNRETTTRKSTYFQGDLPFLNSNNSDEDGTSVSMLSILVDKLTLVIFQTHSILNIDGEQQCGSVIPKANPLIVHGEETFQGQFPWHAALYLPDAGSLRYICGGSLVSMNAVITAGKCLN